MRASFCFCEPVREEAEAHLLGPDGLCVVVQAAGEAEV